MKAFPFTMDAQLKIDSEVNWVGPIFRDIDPDVTTWVSTKIMLWLWTAIYLQKMKVVDLIRSIETDQRGEVHIFLRREGQGVDPTVH